MGRISGSAVRRPYRAAQSTLEACSERMMKDMSELNDNGSPRDTESQPFFWNVDQAAKKAGVSPNTLRRMAQLPGFPKLTLGGKFYIPAKAFQNWVENDCYKQGNGLTEPHRAR